MPTIVAGFSDRSAAGVACQALADRYQGLGVALRLASEGGGEHDEDGVLSGLRSLMVEIVGVQGTDGDERPDGCAARLEVSGVPATQLEEVKMLLATYQAVFISELPDGAASEGDSQESR